MKSSHGAVYLFVGWCLGTQINWADATPARPAQVLIDDEVPPLIPEQDCPSPTELTQEQVGQAMEVLAATENTTLTRLLARWGQGDPEVLAGLFWDIARQHKIDPLLLVSIAWKESRFKAASEGDFKRKRPRSCGMTGIRTDFKGRPTCEQVKDPAFALNWTAAHLASFPARCEGAMCLSRYNGGKKYEIEVWRLVDQMRRGLPVV